MNCKTSRLIGLFMVMFAMSLPTLASNHYSKVVATAVGEGKVYASKTQTDSPAYTEGSSEATTENSPSSDMPTNTYYLYAQANEGNVFVAWYEDAECSGAAVSTEANCTVSFTAESTNQSSPTSKTFYAKFMSASAPIISYTEERVYVNLSAGAYKNETLTSSNITDVITFESSNENVATVAADGTVTLKKNGSCYIKAKSGEVEGSYVLTVIDDAAAGVTQIGNGDFEDWHNVTSSNHAPNNWNSFETVELSGIAALASSLVKVQQVRMVEGGRPGSNGLYCVDIYSHELSSYNTVAQGNLTTGCIHAGGTSATDASNYNYSKTSSESFSETISRVPSAIKLWVKFVPGAQNADHPNAHVAAIVHDEHDYITYGLKTNDTEENKGYVVAEAEKDFPACDWTEITIPFVQKKTTDGQMYILVNLSTNADPGEGQAEDHLYVDDIELIYDDPIVKYNKYIVVAVNGAYNSPVEAPIEVTYHDNNTIDFNLKNFAMTGINVGNISVPNLAMDEDGNFSFSGTIQITEGDLEGVDAWAGPLLGDIPLVMSGTIKGDYFYVHIVINNFMNQDVDVEAGDLASVNVSVSSALVSTFCAPFTVAIPSDYQAYVTASTVTGVNNNVLTLEPVANYVIPANTPVIIETPMAATLPVSGIYVKGTPTAGLLTGVYENTPAPVGSYVLQNLNGKVGFYQVETGQQPTVGANRCYMTTSSPVKAFYFDEDDATGISLTPALSEGEGVIYNVAGQRMSKMQKGINIINGKKILK